MPGIFFVLKSTIQGLGLFILIIVLALLAVYLWVGITELFFYFRNYNLPRAEKCNWKSCGFYHHLEGKIDDKKRCFNPYVKDDYFQKLSKGGNNRGCKRSIQLNEPPSSRKPADAYRSELLKLISTFPTHSTWWRVMSIFTGIALAIISGSKIKDFSDLEIIDRIIEFLNSLFY